MVSSPLNNVGRESDKTSRSFCGHVNFPELNGGGASVYGGQSRIILKKGLVIT